MNERIGIHIDAQGVMYFFSGDVLYRGSCSEAPRALLRIENPIGLGIADDGRLAFGTEKVTLVRIDPSRQTAADFRVPIVAGSDRRALSPRIALQPGKPRVLVETDQGEHVLWDYQTGLEVGRLEAEVAVFGYDGTALVAGRGNRVTFHDPDSMGIVREISCPDSVYPSFHDADLGIGLLAASKKVLRMKQWIVDSDTLRVLVDIDERGRMGEVGGNVLLAPRDGEAFEIVYQADRPLHLTPIDPQKRPRLAVEVDDLQVTLDLARRPEIPMEFAWDFGEGPVLRGPGPVSHTYDTDGTYTVRCTILADGFEQVLTRTIRVPGTESDPATSELELVWIEPGSFIMGSPDNEIGGSDTEQQYEVTLTYRYALGRTEVTRRQYLETMGSDPSHFQNASREAPVENVTWAEATAYCDKLTEAHRAQGILAEGYRYRLPTEAEWEFAARERGRVQGPIYTGPVTYLDTHHAPELDPIAWYGGNSGVGYEGGFDAREMVGKQERFAYAGTHPVSAKKPNALGLFDMIGNVNEWCFDWAGPYPDQPVTNPMVTSQVVDGRGRVFRGGSWGSAARDCRIADREWLTPGGRGMNIGFRIAAVPDGVEIADRDLGQALILGLDTDQEEKVVEPEPEIQPPVITKRVSPRFPEEGRKRGIQGFVVLSAVMRADGTIDDIKVIRGLGNRQYGFEEAAVEALKRWQFEPAVQDGKPVDAPMTHKIDFVLQ